MGVEAVSVGVKKCIPMHSDEAIRLEDVQSLELARRIVKYPIASYRHQDF